MKHFDVWAAAMVCYLLSFFGLCPIIPLQLKGEESATLFKPPNHHVFDGLGDDNVSAKSVLQQRRVAAQAKECPATSSSPVINFHLPEGLLAPFAPTTPTRLTRAPQSLPHVEKSSMLLPPPLEPGAKLTIVEFCTKYGLQDTISTKLTENGYVATHTFKFIEVEELKEMGFLRGEIAELKAAVETWASDR